MKPNRFIIVLILTLRGPGGVAAASPALLAGMSDAERAFVQKQNARKEEIKKRYFSPEAKAKLQAEIAGRNAKASATPDTSIAKAKSTGVDTSVFGLPLGEPLRLSRCATANEQKRQSRGQDLDIVGAFQGVQTNFTCQSDGGVMGFIGKLVGGKPPDRFIMLAKDTCPDWAFCEVAASLHARQ